MTETNATAPLSSDFKARVYDVIFGTESRAGRNFDLLLIAAILLSVVVLFLDSVVTLHLRYGAYFAAFEWTVTLLFTIEYGLRIYSSPNRRAYITSFYGVIDLVSILPTYLALLVPGAQHLLLIRVLRVLRIFRVLKLVRYLTEANVLMRSLRASRRKITVFLFSVLTMIIIFGALLFLIEGPEHGFTSLPRSLYWAIVTLTTVGYGDIAPQTPLGQAIASVAMITSYAIIAIPTGIISAELISEVQRIKAIVICTHCERSGHDMDANFCKFCGADLPEEEFHAKSEMRRDP